MEYGREVVQAWNEAIRSNAAVMAIARRLVIAHQPMGISKRGRASVNFRHQPERRKTERLPGGENPPNGRIPYMGETEVIFGRRGSAPAQPPRRLFAAVHAICRCGQHGDAFERELFAHDGGMSPALRVAGHRDAVPSRFIAIEKSGPALLGMPAGKPDQ